MKSIVSTLAEKQAIRALVAGSSKTTSIKAETARIEKDVIYMRKAMKGSTGIIQILKSEDRQMDGVRNIDSGRLTGNTAFVVTGILISTAMFASVIKSENEIQQAEFVVGAENNVPFHNSELSLKVGGEEKVKAVLRHLVPHISGDDNTLDMAYEVSPFIIAPNQTILPELKVFADPAGLNEDLVLEIALVGYKVTQNN
ncbi:hypothetical protein [Labilibaculum antarcticum]|uniref:Uncharacterized protein n=1 Tax=Labilibaculum antarcticum TaxID=1717717 RepID=A0A1Y1CFE6_9BACT|nr:hypothetical protein [Labilibaculum antarcticum]BAX79044.1 hypothetical protein ALGA_0655 [Labilibaculum antarcticum]